MSVMSCVSVACDLNAVASAGWVEVGKAPFFLAVMGSRALAKGRAAMASPICLGVPKPRPFQ